MNLPPLYTLYCLAVLCGFGAAKYEGVGLLSSAGIARGAVSNGGYHHYTGVNSYYHK